MKFKHTLLILAILCGLELACYAAKLPIGYLWRGKNIYLVKKASAEAVSYCQELEKRRGLTDQQIDFCLRYVTRIKITRLASKNFIKAVIFGDQQTYLEF